MATPSGAQLPITVLLAARNEEKNLPRCLAALSPALRVIVVDSHSGDATEDIAKSHGAEVVQFDYRGGYPKEAPVGPGVTGDIYPLGPAAGRG